MSNNIIDVPINIFNISNLIIPFSEITNNKKVQYIYSGNENIPFKERHPIYKSLLKIEFEDTMRDFLRTL